MTGPYSTQNEPTIDDQRLDRAQPVLYLDRRTHRGDPPAWLPPFWTKPGIYPLTPESINIIKMVSSLPFDRNATTTSVPATNRMIGPPSLLPPNNFYQQPNMLFGGVGSPGMMGLPHPMMSPLLQQQQLQHMLQYQYQQQQQQFQNMSTSPVPSTSSPSLSSYMQRKPISTPSPLISPLQRQTPSLSPPHPKEKRAKQGRSIQVTPSTSLSSASSTTTSANPRCKKPKSLVEKRRVRFTEDQPEIKFFDSDRLWVEGHGQATGSNEDLNYGNDDDGYYQDSMYRAMDHGNTDYYDDDNGYYMHQRDVYDHYDECSYEQHHYSDQYYPDTYDNYGNYLTSEHYPDLQYADNPARNPPPSYIPTPYDDNEAGGWYIDDGDNRTNTEWNDDDPQYSHDPYYYHDDIATSENAYLEEDDRYEPEIPSDVMQRRGPSYYSSSQQHRTSRSSKRYDPPLRRSVSANRHLWQPSRASQQ